MIPGALAARVIQVLVGVWLMLSPSLLDYADPARANDRIVGPIAGSLAFVAMWEVLRSVRWAIAPFALWLVVAPLVFWYGSTAAAVNSIASGVVLAALVPAGGELIGRYGGGWRALVET